MTSGGAAPSPQACARRPERSTAELVEALSARIDRALAERLRGSDRCALINFPNHPNVGDSAIWLGTVAALKRAGVRIVYACESLAYSRDALASAVGDNPILISGGGNFGDQYLPAQGVRERILAEFPDNPILQLPQSIWFREQENLDRVRRLCGAHRNFTLMVRDAASEQFARAHFDAPLFLCPDMALSLGPLRRPFAPDCDVLWLRRQGIESLDPEPPSALQGVVTADWMSPDQYAVMPGPLGRLTLWVSRLLTRRIGARPSRARLLRHLLTPTYLPLARRRLKVGVYLLARGRAAVCDRLHGHILALQLGIPHALMNSRSGKIRSFYETWTAACPLVQWADSAEEALQRARAMASAGAEGPRRA